MTAAPDHPTSAAAASQPDGVVTAAEIERKFEPPPDFRLPDLSDVDGVAALSQARRHHLDATYLDTPDLRLLAHRMTLRRRTGGDDAGWHLKRPRTDGERDELRAPLGPAGAGLPGALRGPLEAVLRGAEPAPVVRLVTDRTLHELLADTGAVLAEIAQDEVSALVLNPDGSVASTSTWSEIEVELVTGGLDLLAEVGRRLQDAGAPPSASVSKLARALERRAGDTGDD